MRRLAGFPVAAAGILLFAAPASAQIGLGSDVFLQQQRRIEEQVREEFNRELPAEQKVDLDWGGWYSFFLFLYDDGIESSRTFREHDIRAWASASLDNGAHQFYVRGKLQFLDWNSGDAPDGNDDDTVGPNLDRAYYQFDLRRALIARGETDVDYDLNFKIGRDYVQFGTGYALSAPMDHILLTGELAKVEVQWLAGKSIHSEPDIDLSRPDGGSSDRCFWGGQVSYKGFERHVPFAYAFWNKDQKGTRFPAYFQGFDYDSYYLGLGSTGELVRNLRYGTEWVYEGGDSYGHRRWRSKDRIEAWALDAFLEYLAQCRLSPRFGLEYMFASGDGDRFGSPTNAIGGNTRGHDHSFVGFGYRDTGLAFAPRLSNIHVWRAGAAFKPLEDIEALRSLEVGTDWFLYAKDAAHGAVSDPTADRRSGYLGWEMDYFINWRITSDLSCTTRFGTFFPGSAFSDQTTRTFLLTGVTYSF